MKIVMIDSTNMKVQIRQMPNHSKVSDMLGCDLIEVAGELPSGDLLLVDQEGYYKEQSGWFKSQCNHGNLMGNGVIVGKTDKNGNFTEPKATPNQIQAWIEFLGTPNEKTVIEELDRQAGYLEKLS
jgi:hypothetical protein